MKTALLIGCGSKFGLNVLTHLLDDGWDVYSISGSTIDDDRLHQTVVDWHTVGIADIEKFMRQCPNIDLVFFNQNSSSLAHNSFEQNSFPTVELWKQEKVWSQSYFVSCILPFHIIHSLGDRCSEDTKVGWMLSSYIYDHKNIGHADYISNKYQNYLLMRNFSEQHPSCFFGINPDNLSDTNTQDNIKNLTSFIENSLREDLNGLVIRFDATEDMNFRRFNI